MNATAHKVAVATTSQLAADAAAEAANHGGNAVDCGIAAAMCSINTQPGVCALAGGAFVTLWEPNAGPVTIDGNVAVPGTGATRAAQTTTDTVQLDYGGGIETIVGASSIAVPGTLAALFLAAERYGELPWESIMQPSIRAARDGFPLPAACHHYLEYSGDAIFGRSRDGHSALHDSAGNLLATDTPIVVPYLADTLSAIAREGQEIFYRGELGKRIVDHVQAGGGSLSTEDLRNYEPEVRKSLLVDAGEWTIATNPPPAIGGANLAAMMLTFGLDPFDKWNERAVRRLVETQHATMLYRYRNLDTATEVSKPVADMLALARSGEMINARFSGSTVHTSAVDNSGLACSITASSGYGSGEMPAGTGLWLNNSLGELELNQQGPDADPPGRRLPSNMAPSVARCQNALLAIGSPGADRITTALHQFLVNFLQLGLDLEHAVAHPRVHLKVNDADLNLAVEPGIEVPSIDMPITSYPELSMYFGGVAAALVESGKLFDAAADPRREGGIYIGPENG